MILWFQVLSMAFFGSVTGESAWTTLPRVEFKGLTQISEVKLDMCLKVCIYSQPCTIVSFDSQATLPCKIETNSTEVEKLEETKYSVTSYLLDKKKLFTGEICWKAVHDKTAKGLTPGSTSDLYIGLVYCIGIETCDALAWDPKSNPSCYYHVGSLGSVKEEDLIPMEGAVIYLLDRSCTLPEGVKAVREGKMTTVAPKLVEKPEKPKKKKFLGII